jgi:hypothetical protein
MKNLITTTLTVALIAASSMAFAADNGNGNGNGGKNNGGISDADKTGSVKNGTETPDQADIDRCKTAMADDATCVGVPKQ